MNQDDYNELRYLAKKVMAKREYKLAACAGKVSFDSRSDAQRGIRKDGLHAYHCSACGKWHVGVVDRGKRLKSRRQRLRFSDA
jgi:hypothetical protein